MAADINRIVIVGRLTRDCELKPISNTTVCNMSLAANRRAKSQDGNWNDEVSFFDVTLFGKLGEALQRYLVKGTQIAVDGELRQNRWEQEGQKRSRVIIVASNVQLLGSKSNTSSSVASPEQNVSEISSSSPVDSEEEFSDDIPF